MATYRYTAFDSADPTDSVSVDITFDISVGVDETSSLGSLSDAYPNPANGTTSISYELTSNEEAILEVYNMIGEQVERLRLNGSEGTATINTSEMESGVYFYSLLVEGRVGKK